MNKRRKEPFYSDTSNYLGRENKKFQWSINYKHNYELLQEANFTNKVWISKKVKVGCMHKAFHFKELVLYCAMRFDSKCIIIKVKEIGKNFVSFTFNILRRMLQLQN